MDFNKIIAESWLERKVCKSNQYLNQEKVELKWKLRYAALIKGDQDRLFIYFYRKRITKNQSNSEETLLLYPWISFSDTVSSKEEKRRHVVRIQLFSNGLEQPSVMTWYLSFNRQHDCIKWFHKIQEINTFSLRVDPKMTAVDVKIFPTKSSKRFYLEDNCRYVVLIAAQWVLLVSKMKQVVISVWPFASIRTFSSPNPSSFIINVGRSSPCGEGIFNFISCSCSGGEDLFASLLTKTSPDNNYQDDQQTVYLEAISPTSSSSSIDPFDTPPEKPPRYLPRSENSSDSRSSTYSIVFKSPSQHRKRSSSEDIPAGCSSFSFPTPPPVPRRYLGVCETSKSRFDISGDANDLNEFLLLLERLTPSPKKSQRAPLRRRANRRLSFERCKEEEVKMTCKEVLSSLVDQVTKL